MTLALGAGVVRQIGCKNQFSYCGKPFTGRSYLSILWDGER